MIRLAALALSLVAGPAAALSCLPPDVAARYQRAEEVPEPVYILRGVLNFDEGLMPQGVVNAERNPAPVPAYFKGKGLTLVGFTARYERPVTLQPICFGPWCGNAVAGQEAIVFATVTGDDVVIEVDPCGGSVFYDPTEDMARILQTCLQGGPCNPTVR